MFFLAWAADRWTGYKMSKIIYGLTLTGTAGILLAVVDIHESRENLKNHMGAVSNKGDELISGGNCRTEELIKGLGQSAALFTFVAGFLIQFMIIYMQALVESSAIESWFISNNGIIDLFFILLSLLFLLLFWNLFRVLYILAVFIIVIIVFVVSISLASVLFGPVAVILVYVSLLILYVFSFVLYILYSFYTGFREDVRPSHEMKPDE